MIVKVEDKLPRFYKLTALSLDSALERMAKDVMRMASIRVPYKSGALQNAIKPRKIANMRHRVEVSKPYALYQERGMRKDGSHVVRKYTTPNTGKAYLRSAGESVSKNVINYIKQAVIKKV